MSGQRKLTIQQDESVNRGSLPQLIPHTTKASNTLHIVQHHRNTNNSVESSKANLIMFAPAQFTDTSSRGNSVDSKEGYEVHRARDLQLKIVQNNHREQYDKSMVVQKGGGFYANASNIISPVRAANNKTELPSLSKRLEMRKKQAADELMKAHNHE